VRRLQLRFDLSEDGSFSIARVLKFVAGDREVGGDPLPARPASLPDTGPLLARAAAAAKARGVRPKEMLLAGGGGGGGTTVVSSRLFGEVLRQLGIDRDVEVQALAAHFDAGKGAVNAAAFSQALDAAGGGGGGHGATESDDHVQRILRRELHLLGKDVREARRVVGAFEPLDPKDVGTVASRDFRRGIEAVGMSLTDRELRAVLDRVDPRSEGLCDYRAFAALCAEAAARSDEDPGGGGSGGGSGGGLACFEAELRKVDGFKGGRPNFAALCAKVDRQGSGLLDKHDLGDVLELAGVKLPPTVLKQLLDLLADDDRDGPGRVRTRRFLRFVDAVPVAGQGGDQGGDQGGRPIGRATDDEALGEVMATLRRFVQNAVDNGLDLLECFEHFDHDRSGDVDDDDFFQGLRKLNVDVTRAEAKRLLDGFPGRRAGRVKYRAFVRALRVAPTGGGGGGGASGDGLGLDAAVRREVRRLASASGSDVSLRRELKTALAAADSDGDGRLDRRDFKRVLESIGLEFGSREWRRLVQRFDEHGDGLVSYGGFLDLLGDVDGGGDDGGRGVRLRHLEVGDKVEARFRGKERYYRGIIRRENRDGTFDIDYDDVRLYSVLLLQLFFRSVLSSIRCLFTSNTNQL
jgi:Ca2+-binding EF-hand superfamily protein